MDLWSPRRQIDFVITRTKMFPGSTLLPELVIDRMDIYRVIRGVLDTAKPIACFGAVLGLKKINNAKVVDAPFDPLDTLFAGEHSR